MLQKSAVPWLEAAAACTTLGLHAAALALALAPSPPRKAVRAAQALDVQFVELAPSEDKAGAREPIDPPIKEFTEPEPMQQTIPTPEEPLSQPPAPTPSSDPAAQSSTPDAAAVKSEKPQPETDHSGPRHKSRLAEESGTQKNQPRKRAVKLSAAQPTPQTAPKANQQAAATQLPKPDTPDSRAMAASPEGHSQAVGPSRPRTIGQVNYIGKPPSPAYPRASVRLGEQGRVVLRVLISPSGRAADVKIQQSSGYARLDDAAVQAAQQARFRPYTENGIAYPALADIPFNFAL